VSVFYQVWDRPLMTVGGSHWISDALTLCGARNVFADLRGLAPMVSREAVLARAPELIVGGSDAPDLRRQWQRFDGLPAVKKQAFVQVNADLLHRPTPRLAEGVAELCAAVAPYTLSVTVVAGLAVGAVFLDAVGVDLQRVVVDREAAFLGDAVLAFLDFGVEEFLDLAALQADQMVVVVALVEFEHRLVAVEMMADQQSGLLELGEHAINRGQPDILAFVR
jgi:dihydroxyacetone kinase DhaKLM complex PTS-EIIA-like component DhaM